MKILAINGSPRPNGNTNKTINHIEKVLLELDSTIEFEYVQLSKTNLLPCKGCYLCIDRGEEKCPIKDERENLEQKMKNADGLIFASPVYTYNITWIMKNFLDRFAYRCHRPDFQGKKSMVVITTGAVGLSFVGGLLSFMLGTMGFIICAKVGLTYAPSHERDEKKIQKEMNLLVKQTKRFFDALKRTEPVKPAFVKLLAFKMQQKAFSKAPQDAADFNFWKSKGWLEKDTSYYYKTRVGILSKALVSLISRLNL